MSRLHRYNENDFIKMNYKVCFFNSTDMNQFVWVNDYPFHACVWILLFYIFTIISLRYSVQ